MDIQETMNRGESLVHQDKLPEAEEQFLLVLQNDPENKEAYNNLGFIAFLQNKFEKAGSLFQKAVALDPGYVDAVLNYCDVLQANDLLASALPMLEKALEINPGHDELLKLSSDIRAERLAYDNLQNAEKIEGPSTAEVSAPPQSQTTISTHGKVRRNDGFCKIVQEKLVALASAQEPVDPLFAALLLKETFKFEGARSIVILNSLAKVLYDSEFMYEANLLAGRSLEIEENERARRIINDIIYQPPMPQSAKIEVTTYCNLKCPLCSLQQQPEQFRKREHMTLEQFRFIWNRINKSLKHVILVGQGESFLNPDIYNIIELAARDCACVYIDTNGSLKLDYERLVKSGLGELDFSIDGINQDMYAKYRRNGSFDQAMDNLIKTVAAKRRYPGSKLRVVWKYVVFKHNEAYVEEAKKLAAEIGVDEFRLEPCGADRYRDWDELQSFTSVNPEYHRGYFFSKQHSRMLIHPNRFVKHCTIASKEVDILINGDVRFCCALDRDKIIGNIVQAKSFTDIWHSPQAAELRRVILTNRFDYEPCVFCTMKQDRMDSFFWDTEFAEEDDTLLIFNKLFPEEDRLYFDDIKIRATEIEAFKAAGKEREVAYFRQLGRIEAGC